MLRWRARQTRGGGVLSSWVIGHTDRFAAAAVRCPVIDWLSMAGHTDVPLFTYSFFKKPFWEDPSDWLSHSSLMTVGKVTTPTLLMTGVLDRRTGGHADVDAHLGRDDERERGLA